MSRRNLAELPNTGIWYAEDLEVGDYMSLGETTLSREDIVGFATTWDPLPIHVDVEGASRGPFGDVIACASHLLAAYSALASRHYVNRLAIVAGKGADRMRIPHPAFPGVLLLASIEITEIVLKDERADVHATATLATESGQTILSLESIQVVSRAPRSEQSR